LVCTIHEFILANQELTYLVAIIPVPINQPLTSILDEEQTIAMVMATEHTLVHNNTYYMANL